MVASFACSFLATELDARWGVGTVVERLRGMGLPEDRAEDVQIALAEAVNNIVEHAYADTAPGDVDIGCNLDTQQLWISIADAGRPLPRGNLTAGNPADLSVPREDLPEGGYGWFLIRELTSRIIYERNNGNNRLSLCFDVGNSCR
ncbi:MAG: ATP-binding protein [Rhodobacteraceae bacterium]|nr:ATP-binding protein [Paracoccaceae bacterium]